MNRPRGTRDFGPDEMAARNWAAQALRSVAARFGHQEVQTPTFEEVGLFTAKSGQGIIKELYDFKDKGERHLTLRPELTAPAMRMYFQDHAFDPKPIKWSYFGPCFRYDRPQAGRYREFWQFGCEQIGAGTPLAYAELIALADAMFDALGLEGRDLSIGHVAVLRSLVDAIGLPPETRAEAMRLIDKKQTDALRAVVDDAGGNGAALERLLAVMAAPDVATARAAAVVAADAAAAGSGPQARGDGRAAGAPEDGPESESPGEGMDAAFDELDACLSHLRAFGVRTRLDLGIARGLDYYTGIVFECHSPALGAQSQLLGGGGYDLSGVFDAQPTPTMGFGLGFDRTLVALEAEGRRLPVARGPFAYAGALGEQAQTWLSQTVATLRRAGLAVDMDLLGRKPGQIAKAADAAGAQWLLIVGARDMQAGQVELKDLRAGQTHTVGMHEVQEWLQAHAAQASGGASVGGPGRPGNGARGADKR